MSEKLYYDANNKAYTFDEMQAARRADPDNPAMMFQSDCPIPDDDTDYFDPEAAQEHVREAVAGGMSQADAEALFITGEME